MQPPYKNSARRLLGVLAIGGILGGGFIWLVAQTILGRAELEGDLESGSSALWFASASGWLFILGVVSFFAYLVAVSVAYDVGYRVRRDERELARD
ncbi:MAG: hypothetical protein ABWY54_04460 [Glaciihabitans sp.]